MSDTDPTTLTEVRKDLQEAIEQVLAGDGKAAFDVWINEDADPEGAHETSWEACMKQAQDCEILISLFNGHSGWARTDSGIGICHAELQIAYASAPDKVRVVQIETNRARAAPPENERDAKFAAYVDELNVFRGPVAKSSADVKKLAMSALRSAIVELVQDGTKSSRRGSGSQGEALEWNRLDFPARKSRMEEALVAELTAHTGADKIDGSRVVVSLTSKRVLFYCHAIPAAMTIAGARELVGQPFLADYRTIGDVAVEVGGPIHLIACTGSVTDAQARRQLGFPDATVVGGPFGILIADPVQMIQMVFLMGCIDTSATAHRVERLFAWLDRSGEQSRLIQRAMARGRISRSIAVEAARPFGTGSASSG